MHSSIARFAPLLFTLALARADEGKWTPQQILQFNPAALQRMGLQLPLSRLWDPARGSGLLAATVSTGGCSGGFVTNTGLFLTNHHCLFGIVQEHSRPGRDLITDGFLARTQEEELRGKSTRITVPHKFTDVTKAVEFAATAAGNDDLERQRAVNRKQKQLVSECEKTAGMRCQVASFDGGLQYMLIESLELTDIRLVYAPPRAVGEFGGEDENFRWPRHTGDFAMGRAYKDGKPYKPEFYFPISRAGVKAGDFVMVLGYPGRTVRSMTAAEMANERDFRFRTRADFFGEWIRLLEETTNNSPEGKIRVAAMLKSLNNSHTNAQGQLAGLARGKTIEKQQAADAAVGASKAKAELDRLAEERRRVAMRDFLFQVIKPGPVALRQATTLVRLAAERAKPDEDRDAEYQARELPALRNTMEREQSSFFRPADEAMLGAWLARARALDSGERIAAVDEFRGTVGGLYDGTKVTDPKQRMKMFEETLGQLRARHDPLLDFAFALDRDLRAWQAETRAYEGAVARLRPEWRRAVIAHTGNPVAPDANSTLRVSLAHVKGFVPREGVTYTPFTTLAGMLEKHTGVEPFAAPASVLEAAKKVKPESVPLNFLADADTTGGNSGSPVVNGKGEMVGLNFDRVWENVANDFGYNPEIARNISVDVRFLIWMLKEVAGGQALLKELGIQ